MEVKNLDDFEAFKNKIIDIFKDYMLKKNIKIPDNEINLEDILNNRINLYFQDKLSANNKGILNEVSAEVFSTCIYDEFTNILSSTDKIIVGFDSTELKMHIFTALVNWKLYTEQTFYVDYKINAKFTVEVKASSVGDAIKKANEIYSKADFGLAQDIDREVIGVKNTDKKYIGK